MARGWFVGVMVLVAGVSGSMFVCPGDGYFADPESCTAFYRCVNRSTGYRYICPAGTRYDPTVTNCNHAFLAPPCNILGTQTTVSPPAPQTTRPTQSPTTRPTTTDRPTTTTTTTSTTDQGSLGGIGQGSQGGSGTGQGSQGGSGTEHSSQGGSGTGQGSQGGSGTEQGSLGGSGTEQSAQGGSGTEQGSLGDSGSEQSTQGGSGTEQGSLGGSETGQGSLGGSETSQGSQDISGMEQGSLDISGTEQGSLDMSGMEQDLLDLFGETDQPVPEVNIPNQGPEPITPPSPTSPPPESNYLVAPDSLYPCSEPGYFNEPSNCREFYTCKEISPGVLSAERLFRCPNRYLFDPVSQLCQREEKVECSNPSYSSRDLFVVELQESEIQFFFSQPLTYQGFNPKPEAILPRSPGGNLPNLPNLPNLFSHRISNPTHSRISSPGFHHHHVSSGPHYYGNYGTPTSRLSYNPFFRAPTVPQYLYRPIRY